MENEPITLEHEFNEAAEWLADRYSMDVVDLKNAYADKKESLIAYFNSASVAKSERNGWIGWSVGWVVLCLPIISAYTAFRAYEENKKLEDIKEKLACQIRALPAPKGPEPEITG